MQVCFNPFPNEPRFLRVYKSFKNTVGKEEIARNEQFLLFLQWFLPVTKNFALFSSDWNMLSAKSFSLEESKICRLGKG